MNPLCERFEIEHPIVQAGMVWTSGAKLAAAAAEAGCLGLIGAGSMDPQLLRTHILKARQLTSKPIGINIPLLYSKVDEQIATAVELGVKIFFTSAGSPKKFTPHLKNRGCLVVHVTSTPALAQKCEAAGVDMVVVEGFEAGGHNGRDELTTMTLVPQVVDQVKIPVIAAGGIGDGRGIAAAMALGASGVQIGTRFAMTQESSLHDRFKQALQDAGATDTMLMMKKHVPVRLLRNTFADQVAALEAKGASRDELAELLGKGRARRGMFDGELDEGELEIGQISGMLQDLPTVASLVAQLSQEYQTTVGNLSPSLNAR